MKNPFENAIKNRPWLRFLGNKYVLILIFFAVWMLFLDNYSYIEQQVLDEQIDELEDNKKYYLDEIKRDNQSIKHLRNPDQVEKYAREKYYMKKDSEDIYIIEFEEDSIKEK
jgi:cell division protein FtsB